MLNDAGISPLSERRRMLRLVMFYKVVERKIPALPNPPSGISKHLLELNGKLRHEILVITTTKTMLTNYHPKVLSASKVKAPKTSLFRQSFFNQTTAIDWNHF